MLDEYLFHRRKPHSGCLSTLDASRSSFRMSVYGGWMPLSHERTLFRDIYFALACNPTQRQDDQSFELFNACCKTKKREIQHYPKQSLLQTWMSSSLLWAGNLSTHQFKLQRFASCCNQTPTRIKLKLLSALSSCNQQELFFGVGSCEGFCFCSLLIDLLKETHSMAHILLRTFYNKTIYSFFSSSSSSPQNLSLKPVAMHLSLETNCLDWNSDSKTENLATKESDFPLKSQEKFCQIAHQKTSQIYYTSKCSCSTVELIRAETMAPYFKRILQLWIWGTKILHLHLQNRKELTRRWWAAPAISNGGTNLDLLAYIWLRTL